MTDTVLFDMDGTILPMDQSIFTAAYFKELTKKLAPLGYEAEELIAAVWKGTGAMVKNDGSRTNAQAFWQEFGRIYGEKGRADERVFDDFYKNEFNNVRSSCGFDPAAAKLINRLRSSGFRLVLATNPIFPMTAQINRVRWAGVDETAFEYITSYENSSFCKPNPAYFTEIAQKLGLDPAHCLMIGNDASEDLPAALAGMDVFLVTNCLINKNGADITALPHGDLTDAEEYIFGKRA